jgi:large subunit ribosomal protein L35Ae
LYSKGRVLGYERAMRNQNPNTSLIQVEGVQTTKDAQFYLGKRIAYVYRAKREVNGSKIRVIWGRIARTHGTNGVVKARFRNNLPPKSFGASVRIVSSQGIKKNSQSSELTILLALHRCFIPPTSKHSIQLVTI